MAGVEISFGVESSLVVEWSFGVTEGGSVGVLPVLTALAARSRAIRSLRSSPDLSIVGVPVGVEDTLKTGEGCCWGSVGLSPAGCGTMAVEAAFVRGGGFGFGVGGSL